MILHMVLIDSEDIIMTLNLYHTSVIPLVAPCPMKIIARNLEANGLHFDYPVHAGAAVEQIT